MLWGCYVNYRVTSELLKNLSESKGRFSKETSAGIFEGFWLVTPSA